MFKAVLIVGNNIPHCFTLFLTEIISLIHLKFRNILTNNKEILYDKEIKFIS